MSRHLRIMSQHKTKLKGEKLYRDKEILSRDTIKTSKKKTLLQQSFYVMTYHSSIEVIRH